MIYKADLHIHSVLSPCGSLEMSPKAIVEEALAKGLNLITISDHNATGNLVALKNLAKKNGINIFYGMELQTISETHLLIIFDTLEKALEMGDEIYPLLPDVKNNPDFFGDQVVVDENDNIIKMEEKLLLQSVQIDLESAIKVVHRLDGLVFAAHIDRDNYSIISQLGFIPDGAELDGIEISKNITYTDASKLYADYFAIYPVITNSDAHFLKDIGVVFNKIEMKEPSLKEFKMALKGEKGRRIIYDG